jgi:hypothetical protein
VPRLRCSPSGRALRRWVFILKSNQLGKTRESGVNPELPRSGIGNETHLEALSEKLGKR